MSFLAFFCSISENIRPKKSKGIKEVKVKKTLAFKEGKCFLLMYHGQSARYFSRLPVIIMCY